MEQQSTLVLLGLNTQQATSEAEVLEFVNRITPVLERAIGSSNHVFIMFDKNVPEDVCDFVMHHPPLSSRIPYSFVLTDEDLPAMTRIQKHFKDKNGSVLLLVTNDKKALAIGIVARMKELISPTLFLDIVTL